jgi:hypothetical protein
VILCREFAHIIRSRWRRAPRPDTSRGSRKPLTPREAPNVSVVEKPTVITPRGKHEPDEKEAVLSTPPPSVRPGRVSWENVE